MARVKKKCPICGKEFWIKKSHNSRRKTCSRECHGKYLSKYRSGKNSHSYGRHPTKGTRGKMSEARKGVKNPWLSEYNKTHTPWNKGKHVFQGKNNPMYGKKRPDLAKRDRERRKERIELVCQYCGKKFKEIPSEERERKYCSRECYNKKHKKSLVELICKYCSKKFLAHEYKNRKYCSRECANDVNALKNLGGYATNNPEYRKLILEGLFRRPTKPEQKLIDIIKKYNLPFEYTGDGKVIIGSKCPDFVNNNSKKQVIEVFGRAFHDPDISFLEDIPHHQTEEGVKGYYKERGYKCLVVWDDELSEEEKVLDKVKEFISTL